MHKDFTVALVRYCFVFVEAVSHFRASPLFLFYFAEVTVKTTPEFYYLAVTRSPPTLWQHDLLYHYGLVLCFLAQRTRCFCC